MALCCALTNISKISRLYRFLLMMLFRFELRQSELNVCRSFFNTKILYSVFDFIEDLTRSIRVYNSLFCMNHERHDLSEIIRAYRHYLLRREVEENKAAIISACNKLFDLNIPSNRIIVHKYLAKICEL